MTDRSQNGVPGDFRDKLTIETPEQTVLEFEIAGIGSRFLALAFDTLIQILLGMVLLVILVVAGMAMPNSAKTGMWFVAIILLAYFVLYFGYFAIFEIIWNGQTPGKKKEGLRVIKDSGRPITPSEAVGRNLLRIVDQLPAFYAVGIGSVLLSRQNKRLGDFVAGTIVVHEKSLVDAKPVWQSALPGQAAPATTTYGSERLTSEEFALIEAFLNRRSSLPGDVRFSMADQIAKQIRPKLTLPAGELFYAEHLLEAVAHERRSSAGYS
ncbi:MAG TPA: RDD family protein [Candidatus Cybelea sp.]|nr:RDD family protein [Candidatus Cybelea sp.]